MAGQLGVDVETVLALSVGIDLLRPTLTDAFVPVGATGTVSRSAVRICDTPGLSVCDAPCRN
jgi:hypothetical protein